ncbi:replication/maintenance protein RepL [Bacillus sp. FSL K6-0273]|uniref:replication/maintenance protein RepL n=1 Tax=Bacillus TaxID=1386 RepID=UPI0030FB6198
MKKVQTSKNIASQQVVGIRHLVDPESGEQFDTIQTISSEKDINFHKVWITHLIQALDVVGNKKMKVINYILDNLDWSSNILVKTQQEIAKESGVGFNTVNSTIKLLVEKKFLKTKTGAIMLNPDIVAYGKNTKRKHLLISFDQFGE